MTMRLDAIGVLEEIEQLRADLAFEKLRNRELERMLKMKSINDREDDK